MHRSASCHTDQVKAPPAWATLVRSAILPLLFTFIKYSHFLRDDDSLRFSFLTATTVSPEMPFNPLATAFQTSPNEPLPRTF